MRTVNRLFSRAGSRLDRSGGEEGARGGSVGISRSYALQIACPVKYFPGNDDERPRREFVCFDI